MSQNFELRQLEWQLRRVPRLGGGWRFLPLYQLPNGTEVFFRCDPAVKPPPDDRPLVNNRTEKDEDVIWLPEGQYTLLIVNWPCVTMFNSEGVTMDVRPLYDVLAPTSTFQANVDLPNPNKANKPEHRNLPYTVTRRVTTGIIRHIEIPNTRFVLDEKDGVDASNPKRGRRSRRKFQRSRTSYKPLRSRLPVKL